MGFNLKFSTGAAARVLVRLAPLPSQWLSEIERRAFCRLAVFVGHFDMQAASAVLADDTIAASDVIHILTSLEAKSLIMADPLTPNGPSHLLQTLRAYALEKLADSGESLAIRRRYAQLCCSWGACAPDWKLEQTQEGSGASTNEQAREIASR